MCGKNTIYGLNKGSRGHGTGKMLRFCIIYVVIVVCDVEKVKLEVNSLIKLTCNVSIVQEHQITKIENKIICFNNTATTLIFSNTPFSQNNISIE